MGTLSILQISRRIRCRFPSSRAAKAWVTHSTCPKSSICTRRSSSLIVCAWRWEVGCLNRSFSGALQRERRMTWKRWPRALTLKSSTTEWMPKSETSASTCRSRESRSSRSRIRKRLHSWLTVKYAPWLRRHISTPTSSWLCTRKKSWR